MDQPVSQLRLRTGYVDDAAAFAGLVDLLKDIFDIDIGLLARFGGADPTSMPFGYFDGAGRCVANFSAVSMPLMIDGSLVRAVGYQSGAVRPEYRGQGLYRDLMCRAFDWAAGQQFELGILLTDKPKLYEPYGFRIVPQHVFRGRTPKAAPARPARPLSPDRPDDAALIRRLLVGRQPVSSTFAVAGHAVEFLLNACFGIEIRLSYLPDNDAVVAWKEVEGELHLLDIVAARLPRLAEVIGALGVGHDEITVCFPVEHLAWPDGRPQPHAGYCELMITAMRDISLPSEPFMLSPMAEF